MKTTKTMDKLVKSKARMENNVPHFMVSMFFYGTIGRQRKSRHQSLTVGYIPKSEFNDITEREILAVETRKTLEANKVKLAKPTVTVNFDHTESEENGIFRWEPFHEGNIKRSLDL